MTIMANKILTEGKRPLMPPTPPPPTSSIGIGEAKNGLTTNITTPPPPPTTIVKK